MARAETAELEAFTRAEVLQVDELPADLGRHPDRLLLVRDPNLGTVPVRWRFAPAAGRWIWRCAACETRTATVQCPHTFAAAVVLAQQLLGLSDPIPARVINERNPA